MESIEAESATLAQPMLLDSSPPMESDTPVAPRTPAAGSASGAAGGSEPSSFEPIATYQRDDSDTGGLGLLQVTVPYRGAAAAAARAPPPAHLFALDNSGSMAGYPWTLVQAAVRAIEQQRAAAPGGSAAGPHREEVRYVVYNQKAELMDAPSVLRAHASGGTNFLSAFDALKQLIRSLRAAGAASAFVITFLTDGKHGGPAEELAGAVRHLSRFLREDIGGAPATVHTIGFSRSHALSLLEQLREAGTEAGVYRFADNSGFGSLQEKLAEVFHFAASTVKTTLDFGRGAAEAAAHISGESAKLEVWVEGGAPAAVSVGLLPGEPIPVRHVAGDALFAMKMIEHELEGVDYERLPELQARLSAIKFFRLPKPLRQEGMEVRGSVQQQLDALHAARADGARTGGSAAVSADLRYAAVFSKARRQRAMDMRVFRNAQLAASAAATQDPIVIEEGAFDGVDQDTWLCELSRESVAELAAGGDVLGLGAVVAARAEHLVDEPTDITVSSFSVTLCSREMFEAATRFRIDIHGQEALHGGFWTDPADAMSSRAALVGRAREPINAWLPLYICPAHFRLVLRELPPALGYLFTLDPLGYKADQKLALFTILGHMHAHLGAPVGAGPAATGGAAGGGRQERERMLLREFGRLCHALQAEVAARLGGDPVESFVGGAAGRTRAAMHNLMTVVGWAAAAAHGGDGGAAAGRLAQPLLEEAVRRQLSSHLQGAREPTVWQGIKGLLYGRGAAAAAGGSIDAAGMAAAAAAPARRSRAADEAFARFAQHRVGLSGGGEESSPPEFEPRLPGGGGDAGARELDPGAWDDEVEAGAKEAMTAVDLSYVRRAIWLPEGELRADRTLLKAVLVNSAMHYTNALANEAAAAGSMRLAADDPAAVLRDAHGVLERERLLAEGGQARLLEATHRAHLIVYSESMWSFCGRLMAACPTRGGEVFNHVLEMLQKPPTGPIPLHGEKAAAMILGVYAPPGGAPRREEGGGEEGGAAAAIAEYPVIAEGTAWRLAPAVKKRLRAAIGDETMDAINLKLQGRIPRHIYRGYPGDIPNRHGHCNSNPSQWALGLE